MLVEWQESGDWLIERNKDQHLFDQQMNGGTGRCYDVVARERQRGSRVD